MKISDGFKFEIGQFLARLAMSATIILVFAICFGIAAIFSYFIDP